MTKFKYIFIFALLTSCYQIERNCKDYTTGTFKSTITIDNKDYISTFTRDNHKQIETFEGKTDRLLDHWQNN